MSRYARKPTSTSIDRGRKYLFKGPELLRKCGLEVEGELGFGNCRNHVFPVLSGSNQKKSDTLFRVEVGPKLMARNATELLKCENAAGRDHSGLAPLRDSALIDAQVARNSALPARSLYGLLHQILFHEMRLITENDREGKTKSDRVWWQYPLVTTSSSPKLTFWQRIQEAALANGIDPPSQSAIARELGIKQSAVARWVKGGRPKATRLEYIAKKWRFHVNYLASGEEPKRPTGVGEPDDTAELLAVWKELGGTARKSILEQVRLIRTLQNAARRPTPEKA